MGTIRVNVKLFGTLRNHISGYDPEQGVSVELSEGSVIEDVIKHLGLPQKETGLVIMKGISQKLTDKLNDADEMSIFLPMGGG